MNIEVFQWARAKYIYKEASSSGKSGMTAVYEWARERCGATYEQAIDVAAQCKHLCEEEISSRPTNDY